MINTQSAVIAVPAAEATILEDRDSCTLQRTFVFRNLTASVLSLTIEYSDDGGTTWTEEVAAFNVVATAVVIQNVTRAYQLRVRGSGGGDDNDMHVSLIKVYDQDLAVAPVWIRPMI